MVPNKEEIAGYTDRIRDKYTVEWNIHIA
ncbi:DUF6783 domain-containing protein [Blautia sp. HCP3S3_G3]